jgi:hypothetical protein
MGHLRAGMGHEPVPGGGGGGGGGPPPPRRIKAGGGRPPAPRRFIYSAGVASPSSGSASGWMPAAIFSTWLSG